MHRRTVGRLRTRLLLTACMSLALLSPVAVLRASASTAPPPVTSESVTITTPDGVSLAARVDAITSTTRLPLLVMPDPWGLAPRSETILAEFGFEVVNYAQRGMGGSTGAADLGGPATQTDFETVLNWALANTNADATRIGAIGQSYGAVVALCGAAEDSRVKAVVAMAGWNDLSSTMAPGGTLNSAVLKALLNGRPVTSDVATLRSDVSSNPSAAVADLARMSPAHSVSSVVGELDARGVPVLLAGSLEDSIIPASQLVTLYSALSGPKRLLFVQGDHAGIASAQGFAANGPEWGGIYWLQRYVQGATVPASDFLPNVGMFDQNTGQLASFASWPTVAQQLLLTGSGTATVSSAGATGWTKTIAADVATAASSAPPNWSGTAPYVAPTVTMSSINTTDAMIWAQPPVAKSTQICDAPQLHLTVSATAPSLSLFAYLYDVNPSGTGTLLSSTPDTLTGLKSASPLTISLSLEPTCATLPAADQLELVIGTTDARWTGESVASSNATFSSPVSSPSSLSY